MPEDRESEIQHDLAQLNLEEDGAGRITLTPMTSLPRILHTEPFLALHMPSGPFIGALAYARAQWADRVIPVTFPEFGFSYQSFLMEAFLPLLFTPSSPCDSMICTTEVAKRATARIIDRLKGEFCEAYGKPSLAQFQLNVIPHGVDTDVFKPRDRTETRRLLDLPTDRVIVMYAGRLAPRSKSDMVPLLMAFQKVVAAQGDRVALLLVGPAEEGYKPKLGEALHEMGLEKHVLHREGVPQSGVPLYYSAADVFVSLSDTMQENFGLTPVEAMASGLPVVISDWAGYQESVVHERTGFKARSMWSQCDEELRLLSPFYEWSSDHLYLAQSIAVDVDETAHYLNLLMENEALRNQMGEAARRHVLETYSWSRSIGMMWDLWRELSAVAVKTPAPEVFPTGFFKPCYFNDFSEFATECLEGSRRILITERGHRVSSKKERLLLQNDPCALFRPDLMMKILRFLRFSRTVHYSVTLNDIDHFFGDKRGLPMSLARRHLMWLLKYNYVSAPLE